MAKLGDSVTTDHISPAGNIKADSPAAEYLTEHGVDRKDFNSYGSRRGNHEVMIRGTFANIRLKNAPALDGVEGGYTRDFTAGGRPAVVHLRREPELPGGGHPAGDLRRQGVRLGLEPRLGGQGHQPAGREGGHHRELRAHPPLEPDRHGRRPAAVPGGRDRRQSLGLDGTEIVSIAGIEQLNDGRHPEDRARHRRAERVLGAPTRPPSSSTRSCGSTPPVRPTTTATAASCSTCCARSFDRLQA